MFDILSPCTFPYWKALHVLTGPAKLKKEYKIFAMGFLVSKLNNIKPLCDPLGLCTFAYLKSLVATFQINL